MFCILVGTNLGRDSIPMKINRGINRLRQFRPDVDSCCRFVRGRSCGGSRLILLLALTFAASRGAEALPGTTLLEGNADLSEQMAAGISRFFEREAQLSSDGRPAYWQPDFSSAENYAASLKPNRERLARMLGVVDARPSAVELQYVGTVSTSAKIAETGAFTAYAVRWALFDGVNGEGLLLQPKGPVTARVVAVPDADQLPEDLAGIGSGLPPERQYARRLAENGCQVIIPTLLDRAATFSGSARLNRFTNQPHREWIYRQAYTFGRHPIGFEVQKIAAAIDWFSDQNRSERLPIGVAGWGEGGLLALYSAALDVRINAVIVSGYFDKRERLWTEPVYRNVFGLLREFGDAEIARLIAPRILVVEHARAPVIDGPPPALPGVSVRLGASAAPGRIMTPVFADIYDEVARARQLAGPFRGAVRFQYRDADKVVGSESDRTIGPMADATLLEFLQSLRPGLQKLVPAGAAPSGGREKRIAVDRQHRQVAELERHLQGWIERSRPVREDFIWKKTKITTPEAWQKDMEPYRRVLHDDLFGRIPATSTPLNPRSRLLYDKPTWKGYEVTLDLGRGLFVWGYLLLPKDLKAGERRPVIVAQHGGTGVPEVVINENPATNRAYKAYAVQLVERGFVVFAPHFPWRTMDSSFRVAERKANSVGLSTMGVIVAQHGRLLDWLTAQPWVDPKRIGFYGLSWGGKIAVRIPAVEQRYALSICSGDFNEWVWKCVTTDWPNSYMYVPEYETPNFNLGMTFGYAEMAALIAPRGFMVERGHDDGVGIDEWVTFEYAKVNRLYSKLGIPQQTELEVFDAGHEIRAVGAFTFIHRAFDWPEPKTAERSK